MAKIGADTKQPDEVEDKDIDWSEYLPTGDSLDETVHEVRLLSGPDDPPLAVDKVENTPTMSKVWLSGGAHGSKWRVQVRATTLGGRKKEAEIDISVKEV